MGRQLASRRELAALLVALLGLAFAVVPGATHGDAADAPPHRHLGEVEPGGHLGSLTTQLPAVFWESPPFACDGTSPTQVSAPNSCDGASSFTWTFEVAAAADQLWVDVDDPYRQDAVTLHVTGPGSVNASANTFGDLSNGVRLERPAAGTWVVEVHPERTNGTRVRLRAGLVDERGPVSHAQLPNLQVLPPYEFGFAAPVNPTNSVFLATDDLNPGTQTHSCTPDEVQEVADPTQTDDPRPLLRCLRFTTGPQNTGAGHFDLRFPILDRAQHDRDRLVEMTQVIHHGPFRTTERPAGTYEYHATHGHYHYADVLHYEAFQVVDAGTGELRSIGLGTKSGFCPVDQGYGEWSRFDQDEQATVHRQQEGDCQALTGNGAMGLTAGWGDVYRWQRPGQYVDFTGVGDGTYVVRATVDIRDNVLESDESDNSSYALIEVTGDEVEVLERGYGDSPFDPDRRIANDHRT